MPNHFPKSSQARGSTSAMSKRNFQIVPNDRFLDSNTSGKRFRRSRNSETHIGTAKSPRAKGFTCQKKVKFTAKDSELSTTCRLEASPILSRRKEVATYANQPKTSEYAFFKKLKEDAGQIRHSNSLLKDERISKKPEHNDCFRERTNDMRVCSKCSNHSTLIENMPTVNSDSFLSPSGGAFKKSDKHTIGSTSSQKHFQGYGDTLHSWDMFLHEEIQSVQGKTFFRKRQKLRQWVADTSFPDIDKLCSKGHDIVSMLLTRLFSDNYEENEDNYTKSGRAVTSTRHDFLVSQVSDIQDKEHHRIPGKKILELDSSITEPGCDFGGNASISPRCVTDPESNFTETAHFGVNRVMTHGCLFNEEGHETLAWNHLNKPVKLKGEPYPLPLENSLVCSVDEISTHVSQEWDIQYKEQYHVPREKHLELDSSLCSRDHLGSPIFQKSVDRIIPCSDFSTYHSPKFHPSFSTKEPECNLVETTRFFANSVMTRGFLFNELEHKTLAWNHLNESGKLGRERNPLLLESGLDSPADEIYMPINHNNAKLNRGSALLPSTGNCKEQMLNNILGADALCSSSIPTNHPLDLNSMLDSSLLRFQEYRFGKYVYDGLDMDFNHNSLSLSHNDYHLKLSEECQSEHSCVPDSFYLSPKRHLFRRLVSHDYHHQANVDTETWFSSSLNFISGQRCLSLAGPHQDHQIPHYGTLQLALRENLSDLFHNEDNYRQDLDGLIEGEMLCEFKEDAIKELALLSPINPCEGTRDIPFMLHSNDHFSEEDQTVKMLL